ncbi:recombinase RecB [Candidatus Tisiphia endosymbiont of Dioctria rufipes]|uniref:recombinase RecB n=1 Tax=Candidatus Tisiphia endosymbiont of Dioctria rufipes TaxID=3066255 RepID=UPI00312C9432
MLSAIIQKREDIVREIENHDYADDKFSECLVNLVELASGALETFKGSTIKEKRKLINLIFANLELKDGKLDFMLRPPFDAFVKCTEIGEWHTLEDSNL